MPRLPLRPLALTCLVAGAGALLLGCGGDTRRGEDEGASAPATTSTQASTSAPTAPAPVAEVTDPARRRYVARVDRICRTLDPEANSAEERVGAATDAGEAAKAYGDDIKVGETEWRQITAVPVPPGEEQLLKANVFDVIRRQLALRREIRVALAAEDVPRLQSLRGELDNLTRSLVGFARGYGFRDCGAG